MPIKFSCHCGKTLEAPESAAGSKGRCPGCGQVLTVPAPDAAGAPAAPPQPIAPPAPGAPAVPGAVGQTCTICQTTIAAGEPVEQCPECSLPYHAGCWSENGGCAAYGCPRAPKTVKTAEPSADEVARRGWGDTKKCPYCGETIRAAALKCKFCNEVFATADPMTRADIRRGQDERQRRSSERTKAVIYFIISVLSCGAPVMAIIGGAWLFGDRRRRERMDPTNKVLVGAGFALSCLLSAIMALAIVAAAAGS